MKPGGEGKQRGGDRQGGHSVLQGAMGGGGKVAQRCVGTPEAKGRRRDSKHAASEGRSATRSFC
jgi:hypothetical protein